MKAVLFLLLALSAMQINAQAVRQVILDNPARCAFVTRVTLSDVNDDGSVDVIQYATSSSAPNNTVYAYRGPALRSYWLDKPLPGLDVNASQAVPKADEVGIASIKGVLIEFQSIASQDMTKVFVEATDLIKSHKATGGLLTVQEQERFAKWIAKRFENDVQPNPHVTCVNKCDCKSLTAQLVL